MFVNTTMNLSTSTILRHNDLRILPITVQAFVVVMSRLGLAKRC